MPKLKCACAVLSGLMSGAILGIGAAHADPTRQVGCTPAGRVASLTGEVLASRAPQSAVACGEDLCVGDLVTTGPGGSAGILHHGTLTQIAPNSRVKLGLTPKGGPDVVVQEGTVRMIDAGPDGAAGRVTAMGAKAEVRRNDVEAQVSGGTAEICSHGTAVNVNGTNVVPGSCVASGSDPVRLATNPVSDPALQVLGGSCDLGPVIAPIAHVVPTPAVAAPLSLFGAAPLPNPPGGPLRNTCEVPGCRAGITVVAPPPNLNPGFPGAGP